MVKIIYSQRNTVLVDWKEKTSLLICATVGIGNTNTRQKSKFCEQQVTTVIF